MRKIDKIIRVEQKRSPHTKKIYYKTLALIDQDEAWGYSDTKNEYQAGDLVEIFHDTAYDQTKMQKTKH